MAFHTTSIAISTTPTVLISTGTTWAHLRGASLQDPVPFYVFNEGASRVYLAGSTATTASVGFPLTSAGLVNATWSARLVASEAIAAFTSALGTSTVHVMAGRQVSA